MNPHSIESSPKTHNPHQTKKMNPTHPQSCQRALALAFGLAAALTPAVTAAETNTKAILELTGGRQVKAVWNQTADGGQKVMTYDSKADAIKELPVPAGSAPLLTQDGKSVVISTGKAPAERKVVMYDLEAGKATEFPAGPGNNLLAVWQDPKTKRTWIYVNDAGDKGESWDAPAGPIHRFPTDKPAERELFWDRTSSHIYLMFSADGTRACFEPSWANIGQLKLAFTADGKVDADKSEYKTYGGGCFPSMAPDNSYRVFRLEGDHKSISMCDADGANPRQIDVTGALTAEQKAAGRNTWLTRWSLDPQFITLVAPAGDDAKVCLGKLDEGATKFEGWARISAPDAKQCWQSHVWIAPKK